MKLAGITSPMASRAFNVKTKDITHNSIRQTIQSVLCHVLDKQAGSHYDGISATELNHHSQGMPASSYTCQKKEIQNSENKRKSITHAMCFWPSTAATQSPLHSVPSLLRQISHCVCQIGWAEIEEGEHVVNFVPVSYFTEARLIKGTGAYAYCQWWSCSLRILRYGTLLWYVHTLNNNNEQLTFALQFGKKLPC